MSEEILKALTQLFAIITKQDGGVTDKERLFVIHFFQTELDQHTVDEYVKLYDEFSGYGKDDTDVKNKPVSVRDSVKTLGICKKINQTLTQKQKVVVLIKLLELVGTGVYMSAQRKGIIHTVSSVFNIDQSEYKAIEKFVMCQDPHELDLEDTLHVTESGGAACSPGKHFHAQIGGSLVFLRVRSVDMYFAKYFGDEANMLNGFIMEPRHVYLFTHGSTIKSQAGDAFYYSDIVAHLNDQLKTTRLSFNAVIGEVKFPSGNFGLRDICISEGPGKLIGIMGPSGAGKTTLLNVLAGLIKPNEGQIRINGFDLHRESERVHGVIGYVSQDDLLIEELTVFQNLYYNAKLCFANLSDDQLEQRVMEVLHNLGLDQRKDLRVGSTLEKVISGGQRKRLNIALELIREPAILFLDEPTSGLSSRDSENVIDLLKELSLKGKLIFMVIHQPSSDIYKMFDKMIIMDTGGYTTYYGPPVDAITYFKRSSHQVDSNRGQCQTCGDVNPEQIFNIMEARVVDEYGQPTAKRKVSPQQWYELYKERFKINPVADIQEQPPRALHLPGKFRQMMIFTIRDMLAKISNRQYLLVNLLEAPILALILAFVIRYNNSPDGEQYLFRFNSNFPAFILISIIVALFMGLSVSAEEIIRDRRILKRESFLHLSRNSYLVSKLNILFGMSAIQTFSFVIIGNMLLEIEWKMLIPFWFVLFSLSCMANVMGLNISSAFRSAVTVYIMIPLLLIPQMVLSGLLFPFDKLNDAITTRGKVPVAADLMASRWAYEAMAVYQFTENSFEQPLYKFDKLISAANFRSTFLADEMEKKVRFIEKNRDNKSDSIRNIISRDLMLIRSNLLQVPEREMLQGLNVPTGAKLISLGDQHHGEIENFLSGYKKYYQDIYNKAVASREVFIGARESASDPGSDITTLKNSYYNESLADLVTNVSDQNRIIEYEGRLVQQIDPVFQDPQPGNIFDYRTHFFAPQKNLLGNLVSTYWFNILVIWFMTCVLYVALYMNWLRKTVSVFVFRRRTVPNQK